MDNPVLLSVVIVPRNGVDRDRLRNGLAALAGQDPALRFSTGPGTCRAVIGGVSETHLEIVIDRLRREFGVEGNVGRPEIAYKETVTRPADGEMKYARQSAGRGEYAHVKIHLHPGEPGTGIVVQNDIVGGAIPQAFLAAVNDGIRHALSAGVLAGYPMDDVRVGLYDGSYHDVDSSDSAFRIAGAMALQDAANKAGPILLEPVMRVDVLVLDEQVDDVKDHLLALRGELLAQEARSGMQLVTARVPLARMLGYAMDLRERTLGRGRVTMRFERYQPCPIADDNENGESFVGAPRRRPPTLRDGGVALPEPE